MYRGFITEIGTVLENGARLVVRAPKVASVTECGGSFAVNGVCLSAETAETGEASDGVDVPEEGLLVGSLSSETQRRSTLAGLEVGRLVNVEASVRAGEALEGHLVQGHVDAVGKIVRVDEEGVGRRVWIRPPERFLEEITAKGSVAVDGVSLTVAERSRDRFAVALIPSTLEQTTLVDRAVGDRVNLESDLIVKLVREHEGDAHRVLSRTIERLPWAGIVYGRLGVEKVVRQIAAGGSVVVWDPDREGEADVIVAGAEMRPETWTFLLTRVCGHTTVPCDLARLDRLEIPAMSGDGDRHGTAMHTPIDWVGNERTGVSPSERAATVRRLAHADARPEDFLKPGHVFPLAARPGGLRERAGHTEATVELCRAAGLPTVGLCCELMHPDGRMAGVAEAERFALHWGLPLVEIGELGRLL